MLSTAIPQENFEGRGSVTLAARLQQGALTVLESLDLAASVLAQLAGLHARGALHLGVSPSHIVLSTGGASARLLAPFEIPALPGPDPSALSPHAIYFSPEQSGLVDTGLDARSDLYSFGVVLYECLAGTPPIVGGALRDILRGHLTSHPPPLTDRAPAIPLALERIVGKLLRKDPRDRYQTADGARADVEGLAAMLRAGVTNPEIVVGASDRRHTVSAPAFVGRTRELSLLDESLADTFAGRGGLVLLEAASGVGKTWLLEELGKRAVSRGAWVLRGRGIDQVASHPYQVLSGVTRELLAAVRDVPAWVRRIAASVGPLGGAACACLPELGAILAVDERSLGEEAHGEARSLAALAALLDALGTAEQPVVLLLDDGQWADEPTLRALERWQSARGPEGKRHVLVLLAYRSEDVGEDHPLPRMPSDRRLRLDPFGPEEVRQQMASMAGALPEASIQAVVRTAGGNPFLVSAMLHGLVEAGALTEAPDGWRWHPDAFAPLQTSARAADIVALRIGRLTDRQRDLLAVGAVLGRTFAGPLAGALAGVPAQEVAEVIGQCRVHLVWADSAGTSFTFLHDKIRESLLALLPQDDRRRFHRLAAEHLQAEGGDRAFELAYHFDAAGEPERALPHALAAAERSRARFALDLAERLYRIAERGAAGAERSARFEIHRHLGEVLLLRGRYDEAESRFREALTLAGDDRARAEVEERWGALELRRGNLRDGCAHGEAALRLAGRLVPRTKLGVTVWLLWEALVQVLHTRLPRLFTRRRPLDRAEDDLFAVRIHSSLNAPYFFARGPEWAVWANLRSLNLAERYPPTRELGRAYAIHACVMGMLPHFFERALRLARVGAEICRDLGDLVGEAQGLCWECMSLHFLGRYDESVEAGRRGAEILDRAGDRWDANSCMDFAATSLYRKGELRAAIDMAQEIWRRGRELGDAHALAFSLDIWARAADGDVPAEHIAAERARSAEHVQTSLIVDQAEGVRLIGAGKPSEAEHLLEQAIRRNRKELGLFHDLNIPLLIYHATALRLQAEATSPWEVQGRARLLRRARRAAKVALARARAYPNNLPHALREAAQIAALSGDARRARKHLDQSLAVATARGQKYEHAQSLLVRARIGAALGWPDAAAQLPSAEQVVRSFWQEPRRPPPSPDPGVVTLSLLDRYSTVLEAGRKIAVALDPDAVFSALREGALALLRAERCLVLQGAPTATGEARLTCVHGDAGTPFSEALVTESMERGHPVVLPAGTEPGLLGEAARSILAVPLRVRGQPFACLYLTHGEVGGLFGEEERRIGAFLATIAGAALENAEGLRQVQAFSRELEARVEERTAQLADANRELETNLRRLGEMQEQLVQAGKMAAIGTLVAGLSHELNTPLGVILGYVQTLLGKTAEDAFMRAPLEKIERQALRCRALVKSLLDFSHDRPPVREAVAPSALFNEVLSLVSGPARDRGVVVQVAPGEGPVPEIMASGHEIQSVLLNLVSNALDASPAGGVVVLQAGLVTADGKSMVELQVRDAGRGIPPEVRSRIFDPFFTTKPVGQGTGLGLALARQIVTAHGGSIDIDSGEGTGTTARVRLPCP